MVNIILIYPYVDVFISLGWLPRSGSPGSMHICNFNFNQSIQMAFQKSYHKSSFPELFVYLFIYVILGPHLQHVEVPRLGVASELQVPAYTTATATPVLNHICNLHWSSWQCQILNPLSEARDQTHILTDTSWLCYHSATIGTPSWVIYERTLFPECPPAMGITSLFFFFFFACLLIESEISFINVEFLNIHECLLSSWISLFQDLYSIFYLVVYPLLLLSFLFTKNPFCIFRC